MQNPPDCNRILTAAINNQVRAITKAPEIFFNRMFETTAKFRESCQQFKLVKKAVIINISLVHAKIFYRININELYIPIGPGRNMDIKHVFERCAPKRVYV